MVRCEYVYKDGCNKGNRCGVNVRNGTLCCNHNETAHNHRKKYDQSEKAKDKRKMRREHKRNERSEVQNIDPFTIYCECGGHYKTGDNAQKNRHLETQKHKQYLETNKPFCKKPILSNQERCYNKMDCNQLHTILRALELNKKNLTEEKYNITKERLLKAIESKSN